MSVGWNVRQYTYIDIWGRRVIIIRCQDNNSLYCFAIWVVYIQITITWDIRYIDDDFFWIIPSTYVSHEAVIWVVPLIFPYLLSLGFNSDFQFYYYYIIFSWFYHMYTTPLIHCYYHIVHILSLAWCHTCITVPNLLTCLFLVLYEFFGYRIINASYWFILFLLWCYYGQFRLCILSQWRHELNGI